MRSNRGLAISPSAPRARAPFRTRVVLGLMLTALLGPSGKAHAQSPDEIRIAREAAGNALKAYNDADYERALGLFVQAKAIYPSAQIVRMFGYTHLALEHWQTALDALEEALASKISPLSETDRRDVHEQLEKVLTHFGAVEVVAHAPGATLHMNGGAATPLPLPKPLRLLAGTYTFTVEAKGQPTVTEDLKVEGGKKHTLTLDPPAPGEPPRPQRRVTMPAEPPPKPSAWRTVQRPLGYGLAGTGLAMGAAALVTGFSALSLRGKVVADVETHQRYFGDQCARGDRRLCEFDIAVINYDADRADALRNLTIGLGVGAGVLVGGGAALLWLEGRRAQGASQKAIRDEVHRDSREGGRGLAFRCGPYGFIGVSCAGTF